MLVLPKGSVTLFCWLAASKTLDASVKIVWTSPSLVLIETEQARGIRGLPEIVIEQALLAAEFQ